jgi:hypothetical protein
VNTLNLTDEDLELLGLTRESLPEVLNPAGQPQENAPQAAQDARTGTAGFIAPSWYPLLSFALVSDSERGAMLFGPRGCGKSTTVRELARTHDAPTVTMQCAANMQIDALIGCWTAENGQTIWVDGPLTIAVRTGAWLLAEEANTIHPGVWSAVNTLTDKTGDGLRLPTGEVIPNSPAFRLCLLYNEGSQYTGTRDVNAALKRRLVPIYADYPDAASELAIVANLTGGNCSSATYERVIKCAAMIRAANLRFDLSPDILARWINVTMHGVASWQDAFRMCVMDLVGAPEQTQAQRTVLAEIARNCGMETW